MGQEFAYSKGAVNRCFSVVQLQWGGTKSAGGTFQLCSGIRESRRGRSKVAVYSKSGAFPRQELDCVMHRLLSLFASLLQLSRSIQLTTAADFKSNYSPFYLVKQPQFCSQFSPINASRIDRTFMAITSLTSKLLFPVVISVLFVITGTSPCVFPTPGTTSPVY